MNNYHDYVIKEGKFIGKFDEMYANCDDPWTQSEQPNQLARHAAIQFINEYTNGPILECGCGLGYYADWIHRVTGNVPVSVDVSETAIEKAKSIFPHLNFKVANIADGLEAYRELDGLILSEIMWYILDDFDKIMEDIARHFSGKYLFVNQVFYKGTQQYGTDYFTNLNELIARIPFECVAQMQGTRSKDSTIETAVAFKVA